MTSLLKKLRKISTQKELFNKASISKVKKALKSAFFSGRRTRVLRVMSPSPITAKICEKLVFLHGFRVYGSNRPEEPCLTKGSITKQ